MDVSISQDPFAPEPAAQTEAPPEGAEDRVERDLKPADAEQAATEPEAPDAAPGEGETP